MKEFEKWRSKERQHLLAIGADCSRSDSRDAWRAALKWAKTCTGKHYGPLDEGVLHIRMDLIQKELEEKK